MIEEEEQKQASQDADRPGEEGQVSPESPSPTGTAPSPESSEQQDANQLLGQDEIEALLSRTETAVEELAKDEPLAQPQPFVMEKLDEEQRSEPAASFDMLRDVELNLQIELGRTQLFIEDVLRLRAGSVVALDKLAGDPVDIYANGHLIARGEVLVLNDNFCVRVTKILSPVG